MVISRYERLHSKQMAYRTEYVNEFLPILEQFKYQQGSLLQNTVEAATSDRNFVCNPLTPVHECCWQSNEIQRKYARLS